ncbi:MAG TPA: hypothetical protein VFK13_12080 [Gemmatimonadaceae bacterium]|nr:hypothetical protein [Gemmatimonadaceae bacterium]
MRAMQKLSWGMAGAMVVSAAVVACNDGPLGIPEAQATAQARRVADGASQGARLVECAVVAAVLDSLAVRTERRVVVVEDAETSPLAFADPGTWHLGDNNGELNAGWIQLLRDSMRVSESTIASFRARNSGPSRVCVPGEAQRVAVDGVSWRALDELRDPVTGMLDDSALRARFPGSVGFVRMSRAGVSDDGTEALLTLGRSLPVGHCSYGVVVVVRRDRDGTWRVAGTQMIWIS